MSKPKNATPANVATTTPAENVKITPPPIVALEVKPYPSIVATTPANVPTVAPMVWEATTQTAVNTFNALVYDAFKSADTKFFAFGESADDVLQCEFRASKTFTPTTFDNVFSNLSANYAITHPDSSANVRAASWWKYFRFVTACNGLGILGADRLPFGVVVNYLFPAALDMLQKQATTQVKDGWAEWLKTIVPVIVGDNPLSRGIIVASIDAQRLALNEFDGKRFPLKSATGGAARKGKTGSGRKGKGKDSKGKGKPIPAETTTPAPNAIPTPAELNATTPANVATTPAENATPAPPTTIVVENATPAAPVTFSAEWFGSLTPAEFTIIVHQFATFGTDAQLTELNRAIHPRLKAIRDNATPAKKVG